MKKIILIILLGSVLPHVTFAQNTTIHKKVKYHKTWIYQHKDTLLTQGYLFELKDSSIVVLNKFIELNQEIKTDDLSEIPLKKIGLIKTRNKKSISTGVVVGIFSGLGIGLLVGTLINEPAESDLQSIDRAEKGLTVIATGILSAVIGGGIGAILGTSKSGYNINKNWNDYMLNAQAMRNKTIKYQLGK